MLDSAGRSGYVNLTLTANFEHAIKIANMIAGEGDCVLLSPACASFDSFDGYQARGDAFKSIVEGL
jgi:UDP-N-acetylmuramoylalanine--D-glutamate ligase